MGFLGKSVKAGNVETAVKKLKDEYAGFPVKTLIYFASSSYDDRTLAAAIKDAFPHALTLGCSSYAELGPGKILFGSLTAMAFGPGSLETVAAAVAVDISHDPRTVDKAVLSLEQQIGSRLIDLDYTRHFGITLFDGSSPNIEKVMERIGNLTDITFVGGHASDDFSMAKIRQHLDGLVHADAAVLAVLKPRRGFALLKTQSAEPLNLSFIATRVDESTRTILELDGRPASEVYAHGIGIPPEKVTNDMFLDYPLGLFAAGEPFIRAGRQILPNGGLQLFCSVKEGQRLELMRTGDIVLSTADALEKKRRQLGRIAAILDFDCAHRVVTLQSEKRFDAYGKLFADAETAGFATFGEAYIANVNQTSVMALFGE